MVAARSAYSSLGMWASVDAQQTSPRADIEASDTNTSVLPGAALEGRRRRRHAHHPSRVPRPVPSSISS